MEISGSGSASVVSLTPASWEYSEDQLDRGHWPAKHNNMATAFGAGCWQGGPNDSHIVM